MKKWTAFLLAGGLFLSGTGQAFAADFDTKVKYGVNLRKGPGTGNEVIRMLPRGEAVEVLEEENRNWLKVETKDGTIGYISAGEKYTDYKRGSAVSASREDENPLADAIVETAKSLMGRATYVYGMRDHERLILDCSSFTQYVYGKHGISLKWGTRFQKNAGTFVPKSELKKGDLVFFTLDPKGSRAIGHVGIYIEDGKFIHIIDHKDGDVNIRSLEEGYWGDRYITARRVL